MKKRGFYLVRVVFFAASFATLALSVYMLAVSSTVQGALPASILAAAALTILSGSAHFLQYHRLIQSASGANTANCLRSAMSRETSTATQHVRIRMPYAHVLVVDDIQTNLDVMKGMLKPYAMQVDYVKSGAEAVRLIRSQAPCYNAIFMDHMMPEMDGLEAVRIIRNEIGTEYAQGIPIIAVTANASSGNDRMFLKNGFQDYLTKPIEPKRLDAVLRSWVRDMKIEEQYDKRIVIDGERVLDVRSGRDRRSGEDRRMPSVYSTRPAGKRARYSGAFNVNEHSIPGVDLRRALQHFDGDVESLLEVLRSFSVNTPLLLDKLRDMSADDLAGYMVNIQGVKGSFYGICADNLCAHAEIMEHAAKTGDLRFIEDNNLRFLDAAYELICDIAEWLNENYSSETRKPRKAPDPATLRCLRDACLNYDVDEIDSAMQELEAFEYEKSAELVSWLRNKVDQMEFREIYDNLPREENESSRTHV
jgi:CheY-like chemotaxis protein